MDPISLAIGAVGLGMQIFGGMGQSKAASENAALSRQVAGVSMDVARQEQGINDEKQRAMELSGRRQQMEIIRNQQRARAMAVQSATTQGAQFGSGLQGGLGEVNDESLTNLFGVSSALQTGREINQFNTAISGDKIRMAGIQGQQAQAQSDSATAGGWSSLGGALLKSGPVIGQLSKGFGGSGSNTGFSLTGTGGLY